MIFTTAKSLWLYTQQDSMPHLSCHIIPVIIIKIICHFLICTRCDSLCSHQALTTPDDPKCLLCALWFFPTQISPHDWPWPPDKPCLLGHVMTQLFGHDDVITWIFLPVHFFCIQHSSYKYQMLACHLICPRPWPFPWDSQYYSLHMGLSYCFSSLLCILSSS